MKKMKKILMLAAMLTLFVAATVARAQHTATAPLPVAQNATTLNAPDTIAGVSPDAAWYGPLLDILKGRAGWLVQLITIMGSMRVVLKSFNAKLAVYLTQKICGNVSAPGSDHDRLLRAMLSSKTWRYSAFWLDMLVSLKLPDMDAYLAALQKAFPKVDVKAAVPSPAPAAPISSAVPKMAIILLFGLVLSASGCKTITQVSSVPQVSTNNGVVTTNMILTTNMVRQFDVQATTNAINIAVPLAVAYAVSPQVEPQARVYLQDAVTAINTFALGTNLTPAALSAALASNKINPLQTPYANAAIQAAISFYEATYSQMVAQGLNQVQYLVPILQSISNAIQQGLGPVPGTSMLKPSVFHAEQLETVYWEAYYRELFRRPQKQVAFSK